MGVPAQAINYHFNAFADADQKAKDKLNELVEFTGQLPAINFVSRATIATLDVRHAFYSGGGDCRWYVVGTQVRSSGNQGLTWSSSDDVAAFSAGEIPNRGAAQDNGSVVISTLSGYVFAREVTSGTWSKVDVFGSALTVTSTGVVYSSVNNLWCTVATDASTSYVRTSPNRTTWTARTAPSGFGGIAPAIGEFGTAMAVKPSTGLIMWVQRGSSAFKVSTSTNGGATWSAAASFALSAAFERVFLGYNETTNTWMLSVGTVGGNEYTCEVWISTNDGASWTKNATLSNSRIQQPSPLGAVWIATAVMATGSLGDQLVYSLNEGVTWQRAGLQLLTGSSGAWTGAGGVLVGATDDIFVGLRTGQSPGSAIT
jgi:hypothetical protein